MSRFTKRLLLVVALLAVIGFAFIQYGRLVGNPKVVEEILTNPQGERAGIVMLLTFPDGRVLPVNYLQEGEQVFVGADGPWWRTFRDPGARVELLIRGEQRTGLARTELEDAAYVADVFSRLRPAAPEWLPSWLNGRLIVITLDSDNN